MGRKKKVEKKVVSVLPKRLFVQEVQKPYTYTPGYYSALECYKDLNKITGGQSPVGEYVLVDQGTTQIVLNIEIED